MESWECEYLAYFYVLNGVPHSAIGIYEYLINDRPVVAQKSGTNYHPTASIMTNLAELYRMTLRTNDSFRQYTVAAGIAADPLLKSDIYYRLGELYTITNQQDKAIPVLEYSTELNPENQKTRLLLKQISQ
jgi:tetratricopeptide (TPR) repeat protein